MAFEEKPNTFALFINDRKQKDTHPDVTGRGNFNGIKFELSGWKKSNGKMVYSGVIKEPYVMVYSGVIKEPYVKPQDDIRDNWDD